MKISWRKRILREIRGRLRSRILSKHGFAVLVESRNGVLAVDPADFNVSRTLLRNGEYGMRDVAALSAILADCADPRLVFAGAHLGSLLVPIVRATSARRIMAFEPSPANLRLLDLNLVLNGIMGVDVQRAAVGDAAGTIRFTHNPTNTGNSRVARDGRIQVPLVTLDQSPLAAWDGIDLLVMDVEGYEVHAIRGGRTTLARTRYLFVEYAPEQLQEQNSTVDEFLELIAAQFPTMYLLDHAARYFGQRGYVDYLRGLPARRGLLLNLLFCRDEHPDSRLVGLPS
jgi:FkbM family methyltransferase